MQIFGKTFLALLPLRSMNFVFFAQILETFYKVSESVLSYDPIHLSSIFFLFYNSLMAKQAFLKASTNYDC